MTGNSEASNPLPSVAKLVDTGYNDDDDDYDATRRRSNCAPPSKVNGSLVYRGDSNELISNAFGGHQQVGKIISLSTLRDSREVFQNKYLKTLSLEVMI